jgi:hypothetical protein
LAKIANFEGVDVVFLVCMDLGVLEVIAYVGRPIFESYEGDF